MDSDPWASRITSAKRHYTLQHQQKSSRLDRSGMEDFAVEEELRQDILCPYCYEDHDVTSLCLHLEEEHPSESRVTVCPICYVKVTQDLVNHIAMQHAHLSKMQRHRRLRRVPIPNSQGYSLLRRDLREAHLQVLLASGGFRSISNDAPAAVPDSLISSLILNFPTSEAEENPKPTASVDDDKPKKTVETSKIWKPSFDQSLTYEEREQKIRQSQVRASFVKGLLFSTLFGD